MIGKANHYQAVPDSNGGKRIIKDQFIRAYERTFCDQCKVYRNKAISKPFALYVDVYYTTSGKDLDNSLKTILDCLQYCNAITNDNLCMEIHAKKHKDPRNPRVSYALLEFQPTLF